MTSFLSWEVFWVMFQFQSKVLKDNFLNHVGVGSWFSKLLHASTTFNIDERVTWIDIEGVPLYIWSHNTFVCISSKWGELLDDEDKEAPFFHKKIIWWALNFSESEDDLTDSDDDSLDVNELDENVGIQKEAIS
ncbi:hypothetical protein Tco_0451012 [Tanacetum coccineum]